MLPVRYLGFFLVWLGNAGSRSRRRQEAALVVPSSWRMTSKTFSPARKAIAGSGESMPCRSTRVAPLVALNEDKLFTPASNAKLFTTAAVLGLIGPDYRFKTTVETMGTLDKYGRLNADLVLVGRGDPNLSGRTLPYSMHTERKAPPIQVLQTLADQLVQHGLKYVDGDVVADDSYFVWERYGEGWSQDDLAREWGAPVSALTINDNVIFVNIMPADRPGERAFLNVTPFPEYYKIDNRVMTTPSGSGPRTVSINREPGSNRIDLLGQHSAG